MKTIAIIAALIGVGAVVSGCDTILESRYGGIAIKESAERVEDYCENAPALENRQKVLDALNDEMGGRYHVYSFDCDGDNVPDVQ